MANSSSKSSTRLAGAPPRLALTTVLSRAMRLAIMLVIVAFGLMLLLTYRSLLHDAPATVERVNPQKASDPATGMIPEAFLQSGAWSVGESDWALAATTLADADDARLRSLGKPIEVDTKLSDLETKFLAWLRKSRATSVDGCRIYNTRLGSMPIRAVTESRGGRERLRLVQLLSKQGNVNRLLEAFPAPRSAAPDRGDSHLLPLPAGVASLARRWDNVGRLACEILGPAVREECLQSWTNAGWTTEMSLTEGQFTRMRLRQGRNTISLYSFESGLAGTPAYLLLLAESVES